MKSDAQKRASRRWDSENICLVSCKVTKDINAKFKRLCRENGTTPYAVLRQAITDYIEKHEKTAPE